MGLDWCRKCRVRARVRSGYSVRGVYILRALLIRSGLGLGLVEDRARVLLEHQRRLS